MSTEKRLYSRDDNVVAMRAKYERRRAALAKVGCKIPPFCQGHRHIPGGRKERIDFLGQPPVEGGELLDVKYGFSSVEEMETFQHRLMYGPEDAANE